MRIINNFPERGGKMSFCTNCGNWLEQDEVFCAECGEPKKTSGNGISKNAEVTEKIVDSNEDDLSSRTIKAKKRFPFILVMVLAVLFLVGGSAVYIYITDTNLYEIQALVLSYLGIEEDPRTAYEDSGSVRVGEKEDFAEKGQNGVEGKTDENNEKDIEIEKDQNHDGLNDIEDQEKNYYVSIGSDSSLFLRETPGSDDEPEDDILAKLERNEKVGIMDKYDGLIEEDGYVWWKVSALTSEQEGFVASEYLSKEKEE